MKANSNRRESGSYIDKIMSQIPIDKLSRESHYCKRKARKILPTELIKGFFLMAFGKGQNSFKNWSEKIGLLVHTTITKQALWKRMTGEQVQFLRKVFEAVFAQTIVKNMDISKCEKLKHFHNVYIEDSTHIQLNESMAAAYPGNKYWDRTNKRMGKTKAILKIQATYNVITKQFIRFIIGNYRTNDQKLAGTIVQHAQGGDLVIRDLGYFSSKVFKLFLTKGISFISRLRMKVSLFSVKEETPIDLAKMLRKRGIIDTNILISKEEKTPVRLIAFPVEDSIAITRRRKAKNQQKAKLTKEQSYLLGFHFFVTDVPSEKISIQDVALFYRIRWRIEIIFKSWKSCLRITDIQRDTNRYRLESYIYCMLMFIIFFQVNLFNILSEVAFREFGIAQKRGLSLIKFTHYVVNNIALFVIGCNYYKSDIELIEKQMILNCLYESRTDRTNFYQSMLKLS
ncbi:MAG: IS4 family transposase [Melioribacteraceae bacterium]